LAADPAALPFPQAPDERQLFDAERNARIINTLKTGDFMRTFLTVVFFLGGLSFAHAQTPRIDRLDNIKPGVVSLSEAKTITDANISTGQRLEGGSPKIVSVSKNISIKLGTVFGVQVRIIGKQAGAKAPIRVIWRYQQPGLKNPITGKTKFSDEYTDSRPIGESPVFYWNLAEEWTLVPGTWTLELWQDDRKLLVQDFVLTKL